MKRKVRKLEQATKNERDKRELREIFLQNTRDLRGEGDPHPKSYNPKYRNTFFEAPPPPKDVPDLCE